MEELQGKDNHHSVIEFLQAVRKASKDLQNYFIFTTNQLQTTIETLLELEGSSEANTFLSDDPNLSKLTQLLFNLRTLLQNLKDSQGYSLKSFLRRQITNYRIYQVALAIEAEIQGYVDRGCIQNLVKTLKDVSSEEEEKVGVLKDFETRLLQGFDRDFQELILKAKVFSVLESLLDDSNCPKRVREEAGLAIVALVKFNKDVFVGLVLMGPIVQALTSMATSCSIQVVCSLVRLIRTPLIDEMELDGEIPRIVAFLSSNDLSLRVSVVNCVCEIAYFGRKEVIEKMLEQELIKKLMELQRSEHGDNLVEADEKSQCLAGCEEEENERNSPFASCVARFAVQVEVGEGLSESEKQLMKAEILKRVKDASVSEAESATTVAEVLWGSTPWN